MPIFEGAHIQVGHCAIDPNGICTDAGFMRPQYVAPGIRIAFNNKVNHVEQNDYHTYLYCVHLT